jgi:ATP-dependent Clp protease ATP-binding subunit ClpA
MFERYTEKARRVIFFARYEASQFGSPYIETEHLLLGLLREDKALANRFLRSHAAIESIRKQIEAHTTIREKVSTSVDLPLSHECKRVLAYGAEEAERLNHKHIGTEHLLLGLLRETHKAGIRLQFSAAEVRADIEKRITIRERISTSVEVPLTRAAKKVLKFAMDEADAAKRRRVAPQHLFLGLMRVEDSMAAQLLRERGVTLGDLRRQSAEMPDYVAGAPMEPAKFARGASADQRSAHTLEAFLEYLKVQPESLADFFNERTQFIDLKGRRWEGPEIHAHADELFPSYATRGASYRIENKHSTASVLVAAILWHTPAASPSTSRHRMTVVMVPSPADAPRAWVIVAIQLTAVESH